jgi:hypothetical protein
MKTAGLIEMTLTLRRRKKIEEGSIRDVYDGWLVKSAPVKTMLKSCPCEENSAMKRSG